MYSSFSPEICLLGEGLLHHHLRNSLVWVDILGACVYEKPLDAEPSAAARKHQFDSDVYPSVVAIIDQSSVLVATNFDFRKLDLDTGSSVSVAPFCADPAVFRSNDGRVHGPSGALWVGSMAQNESPGPPAPPPGSIYHFWRGQLTELIRGVQVPNSICFSADGRTAYFTSSERKHIRRVAVDPDTGFPVASHGGTVVLEYNDDDAAPVAVSCAARDGVPDGSVVDQQGRIVNSRWGNGTVDVYNGDSGELLHSVTLPGVRQPTCPVVVGDKLFTTSATKGLSDDVVASDSEAAAATNNVKNGQLICINVGQLSLVGGQLIGVKEPFIKL